MTEGRAVQQCGGCSQSTPTPPARSCTRMLCPPSSSPPRPVPLTCGGGHGQQQQQRTAGGGGGAHACHRWSLVAVARVQLTHSQSGAAVQTLLWDGGETEEDTERNSSAIRQRDRQTDGAVHSGARVASRCSHDDTSSSTSTERNWTSGMAIRPTGRMTVQ